MLQQIHTNTVPLITDRPMSIYMCMYKIKPKHCSKQKHKLEWVD